MDEVFREDLEGLDDLSVNVSYRVAKKVTDRLADLAHKQGRKPGPYARYFLEISLGFRKPTPPLITFFKEDLKDLDDFTGAPLSFRVAQKVKKRLKDLAVKKGRKPDPYARYLLEISLGFRAPEPTFGFPHVQPLSKKKLQFSRRRRQPEKSRYA